MSHAPEIDHAELAKGLPRQLPPAIRLATLAGMALGVASFGYGLATDVTRAQAAFLTNFMYWIGVSQGGFMFAVALMLTQGRWGRPLKRIAECFGLFVPILWAMMLLFLVAGGIHVYPWTHEPQPPHKAFWLTPSFFIARQLFGVGILTLLSMVFIRASWRPDIGVLAGDMGDRAPAWWARIAEGWRGVAPEREEARSVQMGTAPLLAIGYAVVMSMIGIDVGMSLAPNWATNMFPAWYFMSSFGTGLAWIGLVSILARDWLGIRAWLTPKVYHDLGKLNLGLTMFWGYTTLAQYLAIWYGNMTEETGYILLRTRLMPWAPLSKLVVIMCFLMPFALLVNRSLKKIPSAYISVVSILAVGFWLERYMIVTPSVWMGTELPLGLTEIGTAIGFLSMFLFVVLNVLRQIPPIPVTDPWMQPHPDEVHVHPSAAAH